MKLSVTFFGEKMVIDDNNAQHKHKITYNCIIALILFQSENYNANIPMPKDDIEKLYIEIERKSNDQFEKYPPRFYMEHDIHNRYRDMLQLEIEENYKTIKRGYKELEV